MEDTSIANDGSWSDDDIYITGMAGYFPNSNSVRELQDNLFNKVDLISDDERRWKNIHPEIPQRTGKVNNIEKFDASFFGISYKEACTMDPMSRLFMERAYECLIDAGINPSELKNSNTGVFVGSCFSESERMWFYDKMKYNDHGITGCSRAMCATRVSRWLGLRGPSYAIDTACSSSLYALENAYRAIRDGSCDAAIVGGINLCLHPCPSFLFSRVGVLSADGKCKSFDSRADGYARSESIVACFLQKSKDSRRVYAKLVHAKTNCDGYKSEGISYPSGRVQQLLLEDFYTECAIDPSDVEFVEAHGTGTFVGDPEELNAIDNIFCKNRKGPLLIGSVKSNLGHSEASSGLNSIAKACIAYNTGYLPPNINYIKYRENVPGLVEGRLRVVQEKTPWNRGLLALNGFGFGGANAHILLSNVAKEKVRNGVPSDGIPRLVCVSGRTESAIARILDSLESRPVDVEEVRLLHAIHEKNIEGHEYRGFVLLDSTMNSSVCLFRDQKRMCRPRVQPAVCFYYTELGAQWSTLVKQLIIFPSFSNAVQKCFSSLKKYGFDLSEVVNGDTTTQYEFSKVGVTAVYIGLTDILKNSRVYADHVMSSFPEIGDICTSYAKGILTAEQAIILAYEINLKSKNHEMILSSPFPHTDEDLIAKLPSEKNTIVVQLGCHDSLKTREKLMINHKYVTFVPLCSDIENNVCFLLTALGKLFQLGLNPLLANIYPEVIFPVAQGTPMLSHLVEWDHNDNWHVMHFGEGIIKIPYGQRTVRISMTDNRYSYILGHVIDGRVIIPGTFYLVLVWETYALMRGRLYSEISIEFNEVCFKRATYLNKDTVVYLTITLHESGAFEVSEKNILVVKGHIQEKKFNKMESKEYINETTDVCADESKTMSSKDFYKELGIRGYEYRGLFRSVESINVEMTRGRIAWHNNWAAFLDSILLQPVAGVQPTRLLYMPTRLEHLSIDIPKHKQILSSDDSKSFELRVRNGHDDIRAGGVHLIGPHVVSVERKTPKGIPIYEKSLFVPNVSDEKIPVENIIRGDLQLIYENILINTFKTIELIDDEYTSHNLEPISEIIAAVLAATPLVRAEIIALCTKNINLSNVTVINKKISDETNCMLFVGANLLRRENVLRKALGILIKGGFILTREIRNPSLLENSSNFNVITIHNTGYEYLVLIRQKEELQATKYIQIVTEDRKFSWMVDVKKEMNQGRRVVLYNQDEPFNGLLGLVNCLRREPGGEMVRGLLIADPTAPAFNPDCKLYKDHLNKDLAINVFKSGVWGTYRHLLLEEIEAVPVAHAYVNIGSVGDLNSLQWFEGQYSVKQFQVDSGSLIQVYSSALNFRDIMTALGRLTADTVAQGRLSVQCVQGIEFAGRTESGMRVMGIGDSGSISNCVKVDFKEDLIWPVLDEWTFGEAVTIPVAYGTAYLSLVMMGKVRAGESILIHAGSGGLGQAAIRVALHHGLEVFTTVGTPAKRAFIKKLFPQITDSHIGSSRDTSFEKMILSETNGRGVDLVLNSLAEDKLQATVRCLRRNGRFLEVGKYDIVNNSLIDTSFFKNDIAFYSVMLDFTSSKFGSYMGCHKLRMKLRELVFAGIINGVVQPLTNCIFERHEVLAAYRYMAAGKHIGKIVIKIREEEPSGNITKPTSILIDAVPRYTCDESSVYILVGGLGGFGLELADWLILRGARKLLMVSRRGIQNGYQQLRMRDWRSYGALVEISKHDVTTEAGCMEMLNMAATMGPVKAIFNLAAVLNVAVFQNQTPETFASTFGPKAMATIHLDKLSRTLCPALKDFVIFSSVVCGRGNQGQTEYGFSNSVMERICEEREKNGFPALAIQWGAIGDVGLIADTHEDNYIQVEVGGTLQQRISSCLQAMDKFLKQDAVIVSSLVVAEKKSSDINKQSVVDVIANILGIKDVEKNSWQTPLPEMGMDSVTAVEIKQTLERVYEIFLTAKEIRLLTFAALSELAEDDSVNNDKIYSEASTPANFGLDMLIKNFGDETLLNKPYVYLNSNIAERGDNEKIIFMLPGIESCANTFDTLSSKIDARTCVLQLGLENKDHTLGQLIDRIYHTITNLLHPGVSFALLGYSFGVIPILGLAARLEDKGYKGLVFCVDGSPEYTQAIVKNCLASSSDIQIQNQIICHTFNTVCPNYNMYQTLIEKLTDIESFEDRIKCAIDMCPVDIKYSDNFLFSIAEVIYKRINILLQCNVSNFPQIKSPMVIIRTRKTAFKINCNDSYGLEKITKSDITVHHVNANHSTIIDSDECADIINASLSKMTLTGL